MKKKLSVLLLILFGLGQINAQKTATIYIVNPGGQWLRFCFMELMINDKSQGQIPSKSYISMTVPEGFVNIIVNCTMPAFLYKTVIGGTPLQVMQTSLQAAANEKYYIKITDNIPLKPELKILSAKEIAQIEKKLDKNISFAGAYSAIPKDEVSTPNAKVVAAAKNTPKSDVDKNIPTTNKSMDDTYVLIIANEEYLFVDPVNFASHDGEMFKEYCVKTLGIPEKQIRYCPNASYGILSGGIDWLKYALDNFENSKAIVYYCGHGIPDEKTGDAYIIPIDGKGTNTTTCYSLNKLYTTLSSTHASRVTYFMDACFTGANKEGSMLVAARGVAREAKKEVLAGNTIVFSASSGDETAMTYAEKGHGLFTYFLLKKLQDTQGNVSYQDLADYINANVKKEAFLINEKPQTPVVATSKSAAVTWKTMKF